MEKVIKKFFDWIKKITYSERLVKYEFVIFDIEKNDQPMKLSKDYLHDLRLNKIARLNKEARETLNDCIEITKKLRNQQNQQPMKTYILKKDTPKSKAGEKVMFRSEHINDYTHEWYETESGESFNEFIIEDNPEWFEEETFKNQGAKSKSLCELKDRLIDIAKDVKDNSRQIYELSWDYSIPYEPTDMIEINFELKVTQKQ